MKGDHPGFANSGGTGNTGGSTYKNGVDYNTAGSSSIGSVESMQTTSNSHSMPLSATPNSVTKNYKGGKLDRERYYGSDGKAYLDIDYTNHGNPKTHPHVPHQHKITYEDGKPHRQKTDGRIQ